MKRYLFAATIIMLSVVVERGMAQLGSQCSAFDEHLRSVVENYIKGRYELPSPVTIRDKGVVDDTCYRRLEVNSVGNAAPTIVYLSPDQRFVTTALFDIHVDPVVERRKAAEATSKLLTADESPALGATQGVSTVVIFTDYQCPFCKRLNGWTDVVLTQESQVRIIVKQRPLSMHRWAQSAAEISACSWQQGPRAFANIQRFLFANQELMNEMNLNDKLAEFLDKNLFVNGEKLHGCVASGQGKKITDRDLRLAETFHVNATPTVFINGVRQRGFRSIDELKIAVRGVDPKPIS